MKWILFCGIYIVSILMLIIINFSNTKMKNTEFLCFSKEHTTTAKGFAMVCVMLCHYMGHFGGGVTIFTPLGGTGVAAFLVLSGYGLNESWGKKRNISLAEGSWMSYSGGGGGILLRDYRLYLFHMLY